jgi:CheY-like chemotaxis protein
VVSANAYQTDRKQSFAAGCDDFVAKPLQIPELLRKLKLHLGLDWIYRKDDGTGNRIPTQETMIPPPPEVLEELAACARMGDMRGLTDRLKALIDEDFQYLPYARHLQGLAKEFRVADIKAVLAAALQNKK